MLFPQLAGVVLEQVITEQQIVRVRARTRSVAASCPACGVPARRVHAYHTRRLADVPVGSRTVVVDLRVRRLVCEARGCVRTSCPRSRRSGPPSRASPPTPTWPFSPSLQPSPATSDISNSPCRTRSKEKGNRSHRPQAPRHGITQDLDHALAHVIAQPIAVPGIEVQQPLHALGARLPSRLGRRPAVLTLTLTGQASYIGAHLPTRFHPRESAREPAEERRESR